MDIDDIPKKDLDIFLQWYEKVWKERCRGQITWRGLQCCYRQIHPGKCFSLTKQCEFTPENYDAPIFLKE